MPADLGNYQGIWYKAFFPQTSHSEKTTCKKQDSYEPLGAKIHRHKNDMKAALKSGAQKTDSWCVGLFWSLTASGIRGDNG